MAQQRPELGVGGVGVGVEVDDRDPPPPDMPSHPFHVGEGDGVVTAKDDRDGPTGGDGGHRLLQPVERRLDLASRHLDVADVDEQALDRWDGVTLGYYRKVRLRVQTLDGDTAAWLYVLNGYEGGLPSARYLGILADAAEKASAPADYVDSLRNRPCRSLGS